MGKYLTSGKLLTLCLFLSLATACEKGERKGNQPPDTQLSISEINLSGNDRLNSTVQLSWFGTDSDGFVDGYEISLDNQTWIFTNNQDSTFSFNIPAGQDTADIQFYVRSIDNEGLKDPSPAFLSVPLKNTAPQARFNNDVGPMDTALAVATFVWEATDPDGDNTITNVEIRFNDGSWYPITLGQELISFVIDTSVQSGNAPANLYYGTSSTPALTGISGLLANDINTLYIRAQDVAGATSPVDTSDSFFLKNKTPGAKVLWVSGQNQAITEDYRSVLNNINITYDLLHYAANPAGENMPSYWDPTFKLISSLYPKMFINSGQETFTNRVTSQTKTMLEFMAPVMIRYTNEGGKSFITTSFNKDKDLNEISGPYPVESLVTSQGQARIQPDSALVPLLTGSFPNLNPSNVQSGVVPIVPTDDSDAFYRAQLLKLQGWNGTNIVAAVRRPENVWTQVFFALELHNYDQDPTKLEQLFQEILINEF